MGGGGAIRRHWGLRGGGCGGRAAVAGGGVEWGGGMGAAHLCDPSFGWEVIKAAVSLSSTGFTPRGDPCGFVPLMHFCPDLMIFPPPRCTKASHPGFALITAHPMGVSLPLVRFGRSTSSSRGSQSCWH